ncbi:MAG: pseudouridine-5'-phosphate glycosidase [Pseudomonadota bacterium]
MKSLMDVLPEVGLALGAGRAVVALESTLVAHGLPWPDNLETAQAMAAAVRESGAVPAIVALAKGRIQVGLSDAQLEALARGQGAARKVSRRDLAAVLQAGGGGATTVAATMAIAHSAGIAVFATGGIGGVHRGAAESFDVSADLPELARTPVAVIASGAKSILDLPKTLEVLETQGVPVVGYGTDDFPAFYSRTSGLKLEARVECPRAAAALIATQRTLDLGGLLIANPIPQSDALPAEALEAMTAQAQKDAEAAGIVGKDLTPLLLKRLFELSDGQTLAANKALLVANARLGGQIAAALATL